MTTTTVGIKYPGSKAQRARYILRKIPHDVVHYHEPFVGSASVFRKILEEKGQQFQSFTLNDIDRDVYRASIRNRPRP